MFKTLLILLEKELRLMRRNRLVVRTLIMYPLSISLLVPLATTLDVHNLGVAVVDADHSQLSRTIVHDMDASEYIGLNSLATTYDEGLRCLENGDVDVVVEIPAGFEKSLRQGAELPIRHIHVAGNAVNAVKGSLGTQYVVQSISASVMRSMPQGASAAPHVSVQNLYNPTANYRHFMIPALFIIMAIMVCGFLPAISMVTEKAEGTIEQVNVTPVGRQTFMLSKLVPYWFVGVVEFVVCMLIVRFVYGLTPAGSLWVLLLAIVLFVLYISALGVVVANVCESSLQTMLLMYTINTLFVLLGGMTTPIECMPDWAQSITWFIPARYFIEILRSVYLKASTMPDLWLDFLLLFLSAVAVNVLATITYRKRSR